MKTAAMTALQLLIALELGYYYTVWAGIVWAMLSITLVHATRYERRWREARNAEDQAMWIANEGRR